MSLISMQDVDLKSKCVLIREDLNVPIKDGMITSDQRLRAALPTLQKALDAGAGVIVLSHLGRPTEGKYDPKLSLQPVANYLATQLNYPVRFSTDYLQGVKAKPGELVLCENVRFNIGEKSNDPALARQLASLCDVFVMDAFGTAHRKHASTYGLPSIVSEKGCGFLIEKEIKYLPSDRELKFSGNYDNIFAYLSENMKYPRGDLEKGISGKVIISFTINENAKVEDILVIKKVSPTIDAEAIRLIRELPIESPEIRDDIPVSVKYSLPIIFFFQD